MEEHALRIDEDRAAALDILLLLADAEARWNDHERALDLLTEAEIAGGTLSPEYRMKRHFWDAALAAPDRGNPTRDLQPHHKAGAEHSADRALPGLPRRGS